MHPTITIPILDVVVNSYGCMLVVGAVVAIVLLTLLARADGLAPLAAARLGIAAATLALVGARVLLLVTSGMPLSLTTMASQAGAGRSGGVFFGGLVGAIFASRLAARRFGLDWWLVADAAAPALALGQAIGRCGCFLAGCCWGRETTMPWSVCFGPAGTLVTGVPAGTLVHPVQLYEAGTLMIILGALLWYRPRRAFDGAVFALYLALVGAERFVMEYFRGDDRGDLFGVALVGLSPSQVIACGLVLTAGALLLLRPRDPRTSVA